MRRNAIARIVIFSITVFVLSAILVVGLSLHFFSFRTSQSTEHVAVQNISEELSGTYQVIALINPEEIRNIEIDWAAGSLEIVPADVTEIQVAVSEPSDQIVVRHGGGTLEIRYNEKAFSIGIHKQAPENDLSILVPRAWECRILDIDAASAVITIDSLYIHQADIDTASGEVTFTDCYVDSLDMDSASGCLNFIGCLNELDFDSASGAAVLILANSPHSIEMDTASGKLELTLPADCGFTVDRSSLSGSFDCEFPLEKQGNLYFCGSGSCSISMDGLSAELVIHKGAENACEGGQHSGNSGHHTEIHH